MREDVVFSVAVQ